jgi:hypothetical protein
MNQGLSAVALLFFSIAWALDLSGSEDITGIMNVGCMWLALAAVIGRNTK